MCTSSGLAEPRRLEDLETVGLSDVNLPERMVRFGSAGASWVDSASTRAHFLGKSMHPASINAPVGQIENPQGNFRWPSVPDEWLKLVLSLVPRDGNLCGKSSKTINWSALYMLARVQEVMDVVGLKRP
jgi:hypothetical protein